MWKVCLCALVAIASLSACRKKPDPVVIDPVSTNGNLRFTFQNFAGTQPLVLNTGWYKNAQGDSFNVAIYKYYVSNFILIKDDGSEVIEKDSYHLIDEADVPSHSFTFSKIPEGSYTGVKFLVGVDSAANVSGAQTGALDPIHAMFWDWDSGYIMAKLEGRSPQSPMIDSTYTYHVAGFKGEINVLRTITLNFPQTVHVKSTTIPNVHVKADILEWFKTPNALSIKDYPSIMSGEYLLYLADNYSDMFTVDHID